MSKEQTAVEFLIKEFSEILGPLETKPMQDLLMMDAMNKAKIKFQRQITDACFDGMQSGFDANYGRAEMYYKEKYENL
jgi:hypothetical protein